MTVHVIPNEVRDPRFTCSRTRAADSPGFILLRSHVNRTPLSPDGSAPAAMRLLEELSGEDGIHASRSPVANYRAVFTRDAIMAGIAGLLFRSEPVAAGLVRTLQQLRALQGPRGQVPSNYERTAAAGFRVSFGTLAPRYDGVSWYLLGVGIAARGGMLAPGEYHESCRRAAEALDTIEYNERHLLYVPAGGNWADEYPYEGYILYDQVLRAWALRVLAEVYGEPGWREKSARIARAISDSFWPEDRDDPDRPLAAWSPTGRHDLFDLAACTLLALTGVCPDRSEALLSWIARRFIGRGVLPPAFDPVITEDDARWPALRRYHLHEFRNHPHHYHNGGIWPIWLGWLALAFARGGRGDGAKLLRDITLRHTLHAPGWRFHEYLRGDTLAPGGVPSMAYSATGLLLLEAAQAGPPPALLG